MSWPLFIGGVIFSYCSRSTSSISRRLAPLVTIATAAVLILALLARQQSLVWRNTRTLWQHVIAVTPKSSMAYYNLGKSFESENQLDEALRLYTSAVTLNPAYANAHHSLADLLARQGNLAAATDLLSSALDLKPDLDDAHALLARLLAEQGKKDEAQKHYLEAVRLLKSERAGNNTPTGTP
jgi:tetratricopeptide (TPR) repeat protein